jgi:hypothetical protein
MIWWMRLVHAAWARWDAWWERRAEDAVDADTVSWLDSLSTAEDQAVGIFDPVTRPGRRNPTGRHRRMPDEPVRGRAT